MSGLGVVQLVYKVQLALPAFCSLYTHSLMELFGSNFGEPCKSVQVLYKIAVPCIVFAMAR